LAWTLYLLATHPDWQVQVATEARVLAPHIAAGTTPDFAILRQMPLLRDTFREALRLYPPVPMMVRQTTRAEEFRGRKLGQGTQVIVSPWHMGRNETIWPDPHLFRPERWAEDATKAQARDGYIPFSAGPRVCTGAGFAMAEGVLLLARILHDWDLRALPDRVPVPVAQMTVRAQDGIWLELRPRAQN
jgi:cytochrome P450